MDRVGDPSGSRVTAHLADDLFDGASVVIHEGAVDVIHEGAVDVIHEGAVDVKGRLAVLTFGRGGGGGDGRIARWVKGFGALPGTWLPGCRARSAGSSA
jgi:hypothetical protein